MVKTSKPKPKGAAINKPNRSRLKFWIIGIALFLVVIVSYELIIPQILALAYIANVPVTYGSQIKDSYSKVTDLYQAIPETPIDAIANAEFTKKYHSTITEHKALLQKIEQADKKHHKSLPLVANIGFYNAMQKSHNIVAKDYPFAISSLNKADETVFIVSTMWGVQSKLIHAVDVLNTKAAGSKEEYQAGLNEFLGTLDAQIQQAQAEKIPAHFKSNWDLYITELQKLRDRQQGVLNSVEILNPSLYKSNVEQFNAQLNRVNDTYKSLVGAELSGMLNSIVEMTSSMQEVINISN